MGLIAAKKFVIFRFDYSPPSSRHLDPFRDVHLFWDEESTQFFIIIYLHYILETILPVPLNHCHEEVRQDRWTACHDMLVTIGCNDCTEIRWCRHHGRV
jgi:hypothetical protein